MPAVKEKKNTKPKPKLGTDQLESVESTNGREVLYDKISAKICKGDNAITEEQMKDLLGWQVVTDSEYDFTDEEDNKVRILNSVGNRPFRRPNAEKISQEVLRPGHGWPDVPGSRNTKWRLNGETMIIGKTGTNISLQHRGAGLIFACQLWRKDPSAYPNWPTQPTMESVLVFGIEEDDETVNTVDTGEGRDLADVFYRSDFFKDMKNKDRKSVSRIAAFAVKTLWRRTGFSSIEFKTHAEAISFTRNHMKIIDCIRFIADEVNISDYIPLGAAAALMYLMASAKSDRAEYIAQDVRNESVLNFDLYEKAAEFWVNLGSGNSSLAAVKEVYQQIIDKTGDKPSIDEREFVIAKAWNPLYLNDEEVTAGEIEPVYDTDEEGVETLADKPICGGIDIGDFDDSMETRDDESPPPAEEPKPSKKAPAKATKAPTASNGKSAIKFNTSKVKTTGKKSQPEFKVKDEVWVKEDDGNWQGRITELYDTASGKVAKVKTKGGKEWEVSISQLHREEP